MKDYPIKPLVFWRLSSPLSTKTLIDSTLKNLGLVDYRIELYSTTRQCRKYSHLLKVYTIGEKSVVYDVVNYGVNIDSDNLHHSHQLLNNFFNQVITNV